MAIDVPPPNSGPEPRGFAEAVGQRIFGRPPTPGMADPNDPYAALQDDKVALKLLTDTRSFCEPGREVFEYGWWKTLMYFLGRQWIYWNPSSRTWNDKRLAKWIPKPVTNKIAETHEAIMAVMADITPGATIRPVGGNPKNILAAQTADEALPLIHVEHEMDVTLPDADFWTVLIGNSYLHTIWDPNDRRNLRKVAISQCQLCRQLATPDLLQQTQGRCPSCGSPAMQPAIDASGRPMTEQKVIGSGKTLVISPLELLLPLYAQRWEAVDRLIFLTWRPKHEIEDEYGADLAKRVQWTKSPQQRSLQLYRSLATQSDLPMSPTHWNSAAIAGEIEGVTEQHLWIKPGLRYPDGVYLRFLGDGDGAIVARTSDTPAIPYRTNDDQPLWPWVNYPYSRVGGRLYAQSAISRILGKNDQINQIDSMTQLVANRMGNPVWLEPKGAEVERFTGEPGLIVRWQPVGAQGQKPERIAGENPPQSFFTLRQQYLGDIEDLAGTYDVVKGAKPSGIEAFSALQLLVERSQSRFTPVFKARGHAYRGWAELALELERVHGPQERVMSVLGPNRAWSFKAIENAKLQGAIEIVVEDGTNVPKTALGRRAAIEHANQLQILNPADPDMQYGMMQQLGLQDLIPALDTDVKSALQEQQAFEDWAESGFQGPAPLVRMPWHNDLVHLNENRKWMNSDRVREILVAAGPMAQMVIEALAMHLMEHQQAAMLLQMQQAGAGAPGDEGGAGGGDDQQGAGRAMRNSNQQSGPSNAGPPPGQTAGHAA